MMNDPAPTFEAGTAIDRAVALAGWLAERGVRRVRIVSSTHTVDAAARRTDLPGVIVRAMPCVVDAPEIGESFNVSPRGITPRVIRPEPGEGPPA